jgi:hypothetical protein
MTKINRFKDLDGDGVSEGFMQELKGFTEKQLKAGKELLIKAKEIAKRESQETAHAAQILATIVQRGNATEDEVKFLKHQSIDILKILGILGASAVSTAIPIFLDKILKPKGINIFPTEMEDVKKEF